ncbi:SBBP repeat-containing protein [Planctomycetes bacterium K23_9]|uniref:Beta-propeller repeat protein n=1 Tax=Stieleria marina TaxID=1930275 RepID=A0A517NXF3_9BACT|nr:Beta-propeller repeat protein [Planctomycetes bacterium K23_9]
MIRYALPLPTDCKSSRSQTRIRRVFVARPGTRWGPLVCAVLFWAGVLPPAAADDVDYEVAFSTFLGGSQWEHARDVFVDANGNIYLVGGTKSDNFPTTSGAFQRQQDRTGQQVGSGGYCDAFVCKFDSLGQLQWSTLLGGPNYDRAYAVEVDAAGYVYVSGRSGPGFPTTAGSFQTKFRGTDNGIYGMQNGFVAKLNPDGSSVQWAAHVGVGQLCRELSINADGEVFVALHYTGKGDLPPSQWFANAFQPRPAGGVEIGAMKITADGTSVQWATWLGGSADEVPNCGIRLGADQSVFLNFTTSSDDVPTTANAHDNSYNGKQDAFIARLSPDGAKLMMGTYFGGVENEGGNSTHSMAVDIHNNAYLVTQTKGKDMPVTTGAMQSSLSGSAGDIVAAKFSPTGELLHCTYIGGSDQDGADGVYANELGEVFFTGTTASADFPTTETAFQKSKSGKNDAVVVVLAADFSELKFGSFMGGESYDDGRAGFLGGKGDLYVTGSTNGSGWPVVNAYQPKFAGGGGGKELCYEGGCFAGDVVLTKLAKKPSR